MDRFTKFGRIDWLMLAVAVLVSVSAALLLGVALMAWGS